MKGLLLKDLYILKHAYFKNLTLVLVISTALGLAMKLSFFFNIMGWMFGFYVVGLLSLDKASNWDFYASALPLSKPQLVGEKFILLLLCALAGFAYGMVMSPLIQWRMGTPITESLLVALIVTLVVLLYFGIMMPFVYKFGVEKGRTGMLLAIAAFGGIIMFLGSTGRLSDETPIAAFSWMDENPLPTIALLSAAAIVVYAVCWIVSVAIYNKKEF